MSVGAATFLDKVDQLADALRCEKGYGHEGEAQKDRPPIHPLDDSKTQIDVRRLPAREPGAEKRHERRANDRPVKPSTPTNRDPDREVDRSNGRNFCRIDNARLRIIERASDTRDHRSDDKDKELIGLNRLSKEPHPRLVIPDRAQHGPKLARHDEGAQQIA